jgi:hypothetical protein
VAHVKLACPSCGAEMSLDVLLSHDGAREAVLTALQLPAPLGKLLIQYLAMFRPGRRQLSWERVSTVLAELREPIAAAQIERHGRTWPAPLEYWKAALEQMVLLRDQAKLKLPLKSHGYLLEVIAGLSDKAEGRAEKAQEDRRAGRSSGAHPSHSAARKTAPAPATPVPEHLRKYIKPEGEA